MDLTPDDAEISKAATAAILRDHVLYLEEKEGGQLADLVGANLCGAYLDNANLSMAEMANVNLHEADLYSANLSMTNLQRAFLCGADLGSANLERANLKGANLDSAYLSNANLHEADLHGANLHRADLYSANLHRAILCEANMEGANLEWANLHEANLRNADLKGALLYMTIGNGQEIQTIQAGRYHVNITRHEVWIGCEHHSWANWLTFDDRLIIKMDGKIALKWWLIWKPILAQIIDGRSGFDAF